MRNENLELKYKFNFLILLVVVKDSRLGSIESSAVVFILQNYEFIRVNMLALICIYI